MEEQGGHTGSLSALPAGCAARVSAVTHTITGFRERVTHMLAQHPTLSRSPQTTVKTAWAPSGICHLWETRECGGNSSACLNRLLALQFHRFLRCDVQIPLGAPHGGHRRYTTRCLAHCKRSTPGSHRGAIVIIAEGRRHRWELGMQMELERAEFGLGTRRLIPMV